MNEEIITNIKEKMKDSFDVKYREIDYKNAGIITLIFIDNLCDSKFISEYIVQPLTDMNFINDNSKESNSINAIMKKVISSSNVGNIEEENDALIHILSGDTVIITSFDKKIIYCETKGYVRRGVTPPITEVVIKGPREAFTEALVDNVSLIRRKLKTPDLKFKSLFVGNKSKTSIVIAYINGIAPQNLINYIEKKINSVNVPLVLAINTIEEIFKSKKTPFDTIGYTERPDVVSSKLMEGRVAVIVDGSPFVITAPFFFFEYFHSPDDYYINKILSNFTRLLRYTAFFIAVLLPGLYIALTTHHFSLIPSVFVFRLAISRAGIPFPAVVEVYMMSFFFQILREAGLRLPQPIGQAMSIVGALILGDAAVGAGIASQITVIIVALSSICSFLVPKLYGGITMWGAIIILFSSILGLIGFYTGFILMCSHLASLNSCGYQYLYPLATVEKLKYKDILLRGNLNEISYDIFKQNKEK